MNGLSATRAYDHALATTTTMTTGTVSDAGNLYLLVSATCGGIEGALGRNSYGVEIPAP